MTRTGSLFKRFSCVYDCFPVKTREGGGEKSAVSLAYLIPLLIGKFFFNDEVNRKELGEESWERKVGEEIHFSMKTGTRSSLVNLIEFLLFIFLFLLFEMLYRRTRKLV